MYIQYASVCLCLCLRRYPGVRVTGVTVQMTVRNYFLLTLGMRLSISLSSLGFMSMYLLIWSSLLIQSVCVCLSVSVSVTISLSVSISVSVSLLRLAL